MKTYLSNIRAQWPIERQEKLLDERLPGWRKSASYRDILSPAKRRAQSVDALSERGVMLRPSSRSTDEVIHVASISVIAWNHADFLGVLAALEGRRATLVALTEGLTVTYGLGIVGVRQTAEAFTAACRRKTSDDPRRAGALASMAVRMAKAEAGCKRIEERWKLPSNRYPTAILLKEADVSLPTVKKRLGNRPDAQKRYLASLEVAVNNMKRRKSDAKP